MYLICDNFGSRNKNMLVLFFVSWIVMNNRASSVNIKFKITGHTTSSCDGAFGLVKRRRNHDYTCPAEMMEVIEDRGKYNYGISSATVVGVTGGRCLHSTLR